MKGEKKFREYIERLDKARLEKHPESLGIYLIYTGKDDAAREELLKAATRRVQWEERLPRTINQTTWSPDGRTKTTVQREMTDFERNMFPTLMESAESQIYLAITYNLAHVKPDYVRQLFEWAEESCRTPPEDIPIAIKNGAFFQLAIAFLQRGFALLVLGRVEEAYELLVQTPEFFAKDRASNRYSLDTPTEYRLPLALIPLCKYLIEPTPQHRSEAVEGLENFLVSFTDCGERFSAMLYYYFLRDQYPDVYKLQYRKD